MGFPAPSGSDPDSLDDEVGDAVEYVEGVSWRKLDATMPDAYARRAARAVWLRTEQQVLQADSDQVETAADELIQNESAGGASQSRRAFSDYGAANKALLVNRWPALSDLLWSVMTPEAQSWWRAFLSGEAPGLPASVALGGFIVMETAWDLVHASPYQDVIDADVYRSVYFGQPDPGDVPYVPDPLGEVW